MTYALTILYKRLIGPFYTDIDASITVGSFPMRQDVYVVCYYSTTSGGGCYRHW